MAGGGLIIGFRLAPRPAAAELSGTSFAPNAFLRIAPDGAITMLAAADKRVRSLPLTPDKLA